MIPWTAPGWARALRELGAEVFEWDWTPLHSRGLPGRLEQRFMIGPGIARANRALLRVARQHKPDVVLLYAAWPITAETVKTLAKDFWVAGYHNDNPFGGFGGKAYFRLWKGAMPHYHSHHVFRPVNVADYRRAGVERVKVLLPFYLPWLDEPVELTPEERVQYRSEIIFVGHAEADNRIECVEAVVSAGLPFKISGEEKYWRRYLSEGVRRRLPPIRPVLGSAYRKTIAGARISLAFFSKSNRDECTFRSFEIPAVGGFLLAERTPTMQQLYREGQEVELFSSPQELVDKCRYYLAHDTERERVAAVGHARCLSSGYDIVSRMRQWLAETRIWMTEAGWRT